MPDRRIKRLVRPGLGFGGFWTVRRTLAGTEAMAMIRKGQVRNIRGNHVGAQANFIAVRSRWLPEPRPLEANHGPF
jgi:IS6 family transposase